MFKAIKDNKIIAISDTDSAFPCLVCDSIANEPDHTTADYVQVNGEYVLASSEEAIEQKKADVRAVRNSYLEKYVDPKQLVLVWNSLTGNEQKEYMDYRQYLLDYPETEGWYEQPPKDFSTWKEMLTEEDELPPEELLL